MKLGNIWKICKQYLVTRKHPMKAGWYYFGGNDRDSFGNGAWAQRIWDAQSERIMCTGLKDIDQSPGPFGCCKDLEESEGQPEQKPPHGELTEQGCSSPTQAHPILPHSRQDWEVPVRAAIRKHCAFRSLPREHATEGTVGTSSPSLPAMCSHSPSALNGSLGQDLKSTLYRLKVLHKWLTSGLQKTLKWFLPWQTQGVQSQPTARHLLDSEDVRANKVEFGWLKFCSMSDPGHPTAGDTHQALCMVLRKPISLVPDADAHWSIGSLSRSEWWWEGLNIL